MAFSGKVTQDQGRRGGFGLGLGGASGADSGMSGALLTMPTSARAIGEKEVSKAAEILSRYKNGKSNLEMRAVADELWYKLRHQEYLRKRSDKNGQNEIAPTTAWMFSTLTNKHADAMDNFPEPNVLPREMSDENDAKALSSILPVVMERNNFEDTYADAWWEKLKHGTAVYGVFWDTSLENGLGDISITSLDIMNVFWEPGISDIQKSRNLFIVDLVDNDLLEEQYPQYKSGLRGNAVEVTQYVHDDTVDTSEKSAVVDWYYKVRAANGRTLLHYAKFVGETLLFASENDPAYTEVGFYAHGMYPVVFDVMFPEKGTPAGFGYISITKDPQAYIDRLGGAILENAISGAKPRYMVSNNAGINEEEFSDWSRSIVHVEGGIDESRARAIVHKPLDSVYVNVLQMKIDEMKETSANRDFNSGGSGSGVTAASAIAALQEAGNKTSRDMISAAYRAYTRMNYLCIELIRQFYDEMRTFRITGENSGYEFIEYSNAHIKDQPIRGLLGEEMYRRPVFDIKIKAQKKNPFSQMSQNELAKELYGMGFFNPQRAQEAMGALNLMEFEGKEKVREFVKEGETLYMLVQQMAQRLDQMAAIIQLSTGKDMGLGEPGAATPAQAPPQSGTSSGGSGGSMAKSVQNGQEQAMTRYGKSLAARSTPNMAASNSKVGVK